MSQDKTKYITELLKIYRLAGYSIEQLPILCGTSSAAIQSYFFGQKEEVNDELNDRIYNKVMSLYPELRPMVIKQIGDYEFDSQYRFTSAPARKIFFTSDLHFGHPNIINHDNRPFASVEEMDKEMIARWNAKVRPTDLVYILGDFMWKTRNGSAAELVQQLNGEKILVRGNHDQFITKKGTENLFVKVADYLDIDVQLENGKTKTLILSHYFIPFYNKHARGAIHLHGHSHVSQEAIDEELMAKEIHAKGYQHKSYNVGCMYWGYAPVTLNEILTARTVSTEEEPLE